MEFRTGGGEIYETLGITVITANCLNILPFISARDFG